MSYAPPGYFGSAGAAPRARKLSNGRAGAPIRKSQAMVPFAMGSRGTFCPDNYVIGTNSATGAKICRIRRNQLSAEGRGVLQQNAARLNKHPNTIAYRRLRAETKGTGKSNAQVAAMLKGPGSARTRRSAGGFDQYAMGAPAWDGQDWDSGCGSDW